MWTKANMAKMTLCACALAFVLSGTLRADSIVIKPVSVTGSIAGDANSNVNYLLNDNPGFADASLQRPAGTPATLETGDSLADALATVAARSSSAQAESWTRSTSQGHPVFVFDLTGVGDTSINAIILWQYGNNGGTGPANGGNATREFQLIFHTEIEGSTFDFGTETVEFSGVMAPIYGDTAADNVAQLFDFGERISARYVALRIASNYLPPADPQITAGGDRYGLGEVRFAAPAEVAALPQPANTATDVSPDAILSWEPGEDAEKHDVYFGTVFADVHDASRTDPRGVLVSQAQVAATYDPPGRLDLGQTYYWRIDEVSAPPASKISKGVVWSFTVEPVAYPIDANSIAATASSSNSAGEGPENTINGSGLNASDLHSAANTDMWLSSVTGSQPTWIQYEFDRVYKLHQMWIWNYNTSVEPVIGFGLKQAIIEYSTDGVNWTTLGTTHEFTRGPGVAGYAPNTTIDLGGVAAKYVKITANSNWGGILKQYGLSEVRFFSIPVSAREPNPVSGATDVSVDATLNWRAGREAAKHNVYLSTDQQAVIDGTAPAATVTSPSYTSSLDLASTYYWRVDEVNEAETPTTWPSNVWSFSTQEYFVVDDFESYNDIATGEEGSNLVYETWMDGFGTTTNGSTIGYTEAFQPSMETSTVYDGKQSVPLFYNNTSASVSEVTVNVANLQTGKDWSGHGIKGLTLRFFGDPNNVPQQMYVKVNGAKVIYDGDAQNLKQTAWQMWYIDLASLGMSLSNVTTLTIGLERIGGAGGQGTILLDGIRLYSYDRQLITPATPDTTNLVGLWEFDEGTGTTAADSSGNSHQGTLEGSPQWVAGYVRGALQFNGSPDRVVVPYSAQLNPDGAFTVSVWANVAPGSSGFRSPITSRDDSPQRGYILYAGNNGNWQFWIGTGSAWVQAAGAPVQAGEWAHVTGVYENGEVRLYVNGTQAGRGSGTNSLNTQQYKAIGAGATNSPQGNYFFVGMIDDVRVYSRVLSDAEVAGLAGLTQPFDKPF